MGSVTNADIAEALQSSARLVVDERKIELAEPIRQLNLSLVKTSL